MDPTLWRSVIVKMEQKIKERIMDISNNFNGNHSRTIKDLEEVIDYLKGRRDDKRKANNIKLAYFILIAAVIIAAVSGAINYNIDGQSRLSVGINESTIERLLIENDASYVSVDSMGILDTDLAHKKYVDDSFGFGFEYFISMEESSMSSSSPTSKIDVTTTSKEPGLYRIGYSAEVTHNFGSESIIVEFLVDGVSIHNHTTGDDNLQIFDINNDEWISNTFFN